MCVRERQEREKKGETWKERGGKAGKKNNKDYHTYRKEENGGAGGVGVLCPASN